MEKDYLAHEVHGEIPYKDDYIIFENVGAYTIVFNPPFIKERPSIVAEDKDDFFVVRKKETFKEFFNEDLYVFNKQPKGEWYESFNMQCWKTGKVNQLF